MDSLFMGTGLSSITVNSGVDFRPNLSQFSAVGRSGSATLINSISVDKGSGNMTSFPFGSLRFGGGNKRNSRGVALDDVALLEKQEGGQLEGSVGNLDELDGQNGNWVLKILRVRSLWLSEKQGMSGGEVEENRENEVQNGNFTSASLSSSSSSCDDDDERNEGCSDGCGVRNDDGEKGKVEFDRNSFTNLLKKVPLVEAKLFAQMSYLGNLAYAIPSIKPRNLLKRYGLRYVTSSIEKREQLALAEQKSQPANFEAKQGSSEVDQSKGNSQGEGAEYNDHTKGQTRLNASAAIQIAASVASYLHTHTKTIITILPLRPSGNGVDHDREDSNGGCNDHVDINSDMASLRATTDSVTAVVAAKEEVKQAVADDLNLTSSSPCEWYVCDDDKTATRYFVIQGSETLASWQANLLFEPVQFEGLDVFVHRGIYEAAKGMYQQMLPEVDAFMKTHGKHAKFRFTGHSLGGSLSMLINFMLLMRSVVPHCSLLPVITFGSPCIMCGGDYLLQKLGLPKNHVQAIVMHRDIVPRVFSCHYPRPAAELLKAVNGNLRNHPCLNNQKLLYAPMGEMLILQPDPKHSPQHHLLPSGTGLFLLTSEAYDADDAEKQLQSAKSAFLNTPHPLGILSDRSAYGNDGPILRDHDISSYLKCLRNVIRQELSRLRKAEKERRQKAWWPLGMPRLIVGTALSPSNLGHTQFRFPTTGIRESLKRLSRLVKSQHMNLVVVLLFPARILLVGAYSMINNGMIPHF